MLFICKSLESAGLIFTPVVKSMGRKVGKNSA